MSSPAVSMPTSSKVLSPGRSRPRFYVGVSLFMVVLVLAGFWPSYFGPLLRGVAARPWIIQLHGVVFVGWMVLLVTQVLLAASGRTAAHRKLGTAGIVYGFLVLALGLAASFAAPILHMKAGEWDLNRAASFLLIPLGDMVLFGTLFGAAVAYRNKPETHKRLILAATVALLFAAVGRMQFIPSLPLSLIVWLSPLLLGMGYDVLTRRRIHHAYIFSLAALLIGFSRLLFLQSGIWLRIGRGVLQAMTNQ